MIYFTFLHYFYHTIPDHTELSGSSIFFLINNKLLYIFSDHFGLLKCFIHNIILRSPPVYTYNNNIGNSTLYYNAYYVYYVIHTMIMKRILSIPDTNIVSIFAETCNYSNHLNMLHNIVSCIFTKCCILIF